MLKGWNKNRGVWEAYNSLEGGSKTIAYGHKIVEACESFNSLTDKEATELFNRDYAKHKIEAAKYYNSKYGCKKGQPRSKKKASGASVAAASPASSGGTAAAPSQENKDCKNFEDLPEYMQHIATDMKFNVGGKFPKLAKAMHDNSLEGLVRESKTYYREPGNPNPILLGKRSNCRGDYIRANHVKNPTK